MKQNVILLFRKVFRRKWCSRRKIPCANNSSYEITSFTAKKTCDIPQDIVWTGDFIDGQISKESNLDALKQNCNALTIHHLNNKKDENKPLIKGRICNQQTKIFIDVGDEVIVIDEILFNSLEIDSNKIMRSKDNLNSIC